MPWAPMSLLLGTYTPCHPASEYDGQTHYISIVAQNIENGKLFVFQEAAKSRQHLGVQLTCVLSHSLQVWSQVHMGFQSLASYVAWTDMYLLRWYSCQLTMQLSCCIHFSWALALRIEWVLPTQQIHVAKRLYKNSRKSLFSLWTVLASKIQKLLHTLSGCT